MPDHQAHGQQSRRGTRTKSAAAHRIYVRGELSDSDLEAILDELGLPRDPDSVDHEVDGPSPGPGTCGSPTPGLAGSPADAATKRAERRDE